MNTKMDNAPQFRIGSIHSSKDREYGIKLLSQGYPIGVFNRGVCAIWGDGSNKKTIDLIEEIKGEDRGVRPVALTLSLDELVPMLDIEKLHPSTRDLFLVVSDLKSKIGSLCFIRAPIKTSHAKKIPQRAKSRENGLVFIQNWDAYGHDPTEDLILLAHKFGVNYPVVTSMNKSGHPEIIDQDQGERFCKKEGIPIFLRDPLAHPNLKGSYTIISFDREGVKLIRDGNIPCSIIEKILQLPIDKSQSRKPNHPQMNFPSHLTSGHPRKIRDAVLLYIKGDYV